MDFVKKANLPQNKVCAVILSPLFKSVIADLEELDVDLIFTEKCPYLSEPVAYHADMLVHHLGGEDILLHQSQGYEPALSALGMNVIYSNEKLNPDYPNDVKFNAARIGDYLICKKDSAEGNILKSVPPRNIIDVPQGYSKCSTLIVDEKSVVTADVHIHERAIKNGIDSLLIPPGNISLPGYDYGFIGGTGAKLSKDNIYFTGNLMSHPSGKEIADFITKRDISIIMGSSEKLIDIGGIIPILT